MKRSIRRFQFTADNQPLTLELQSDAQVIHVDFWAGLVTLWIDTGKRKESMDRTYYVSRTGEEPKGRHVGTVFAKPQGPFFHVYEWLES